MKIEAVHIRNYRSLRDVKLEGLGNLVILIGPNSSGKSNILEALYRFFTEISAESIPPTSMDKYLWFDGNYKEPIMISATLKLGEEDCKEIFPMNSIEVKEMFGENYQQLKIYRKIIRDGGWRTEVIAWGDILLVMDGKIKSVIQLHNGELLFNNEIEVIVRKIIEKLKRSFKLITAARDMPPQNSLYLLQRQPLLEPKVQEDLHNLATSQETAEAKKWREVKERFREITGCELYQDLRIEEGDVILPLQYRGGGEQELIGLLYHLVAGEEDIIAIEEPELHTHPQLARKIFELLKELSKEKQIFIVTHSTIFVDLADINNVWLVRKQGKETVITRMSEPEDLPYILHELGVRPSDIFFSDAVIFVEGDTEKVVFPILAEKMGIKELRSPRIAIIPTGGKNRGIYYVDVWIRINKAADIPFFMIFDKDAENDKEIRKFIEEKELKRGENLFILNKGSIEDYYPPNRVIEAIESIHKIKLNDEEKKKILQPPEDSSRAKVIEEIVRKYKLSKVRIGEEVAKSMSPDEIDGEIRAILESIYRRLQL